MEGRVGLLLERVGGWGGGGGGGGEGEEKMRGCGPIGADPDRLVQQQEILDVS